MKNFYILENSGIILDDIAPNKNDRLSKKDSDYEGISRVFLVDEPMHVVYKRGTEIKEFDVEKDDIIVTFYRENVVNHVAVVKSSAWVQNIKYEREEDQRRKEEWAKREAEQAESTQKKQ